MADFTEIYKQSGSLCFFSPNGEYVATAVQKRLVIRETHSLQIVQLYNCLDTIEEIVWAADSDLILVASYKLGSFQVFSISDETWTAQIDEGIHGCSRVEFAPDARHILSFSDYELLITIWSLITKEAMYIQYPKNIDRGHQFRSDGSYFCLLERIDGNDVISIFDTVDWTLTKRFPIETVNAFDLSWSPDGRFIAVWESLLDVFIANVVQGLYLPSRWSLGFQLFCI
jgi:WD40 repeat protein